MDAIRYRDTREELWKQKEIFVPSGPELSQVVRTQR